MCVRRWSRVRTGLNSITKPQKAAICGLVPVRSSSCGQKMREESGRNSDPQSSEYIFPRRACEPPGAAVAAQYAGPFSRSYLACMVR